jgi:hypothetical protein
MQLDYHSIHINLMHNQVKHNVKIQNKREGHWLNAPGLALITTILAYSQLDACGPSNIHWTCSA